MDGWRGPGRGVATVNGNAAEAMVTGEAKVFCCGLSNAIKGVAERSMGSNIRVYSSRIASNNISFFLTQIGMKLPYLNNQTMSDNNGICASGWLGVMLSDLILVSLITSKYIT